MTRIRDITIGGFSVLMLAGCTTDDQEAANALISGMATGVAIANAASGGSGSYGTYGNSGSSGGSSTYSSSGGYGGGGGGCGGGTCPGPGSCGIR